MNMYEAFMRAADFVERNPSRYEIENIIIPRDDGPGSTGCMWGWAGYFLDEKLRGKPVAHMSEVSGIHEAVIVHRPLIAITRDPVTDRQLNVAHACDGVTCMRLLAEKYFGHLKPGAPVPAVVTATLDPAYLELKKQLEGATGLKFVIKEVVAVEEAA